MRDITPAAEAYIIVDGVQFFTLRVTDLQLGLNSSWTPYGQARVTAALDEAIAAAIDPTASGTSFVQFRLTRNVFTGDELQSRDYYFAVRSVRKNYTRGTMTVTLTTYERPASQWVLTGTDATWPTGTPLVDIVSQVVVIASPGALDVTGDPPLTYTVPEDVTWEVGQDAMSFLKPLVDPSGRKLICDDKGHFRLIVPGTPITEGPTTPRLYEWGDLIEYETSADLDSGEYADDVLLMYEWTDDLGVTHRRTDVSTPSGADNPKWVVERPTGRYPGPGAANQVKKRLNAWRHERTFRMLWDLELAPGIVAAIRHPDGTITQGLVHSVTWREDGTMDVVAAYAEYDTGWQPVTLSADFVPYTGNPPPTWRRVGSVVEVRGAVSPATSTTAADISGGVTGIVVCTLPAEALPSTTQEFSTLNYVSQASGVDRWSPRFYLASGELRAGRYAPGAATTSTWLPFNFVYLTD